MIELLLPADKNLHCSTTKESTEGTSLTLLEAMSMKKAILATAVGGNNKVLKAGETGVLIESNDQQALLTEFIAFHANNERREKLRHNAQAS